MINAREWARRNARPVVVVMALVLVAVFCVFAYAVNAIVDGSPFHLASQAAGSDARFREILGAGDWNTLSEGQVYGSLALDTVFAVVYGFGLWCYLNGHFDVVEGPATRWGARGLATSLYIRDPDANTVELRYYPT